MFRSAGARTVKRLAISHAAMLVFGLWPAGIFGATSATLSSASANNELAPVVFETEIVRTTEPLSLFNMLPPPLPLRQVQELQAKGNRPTKTATPISTAPGMPLPSPATTSTMRWSLRPTPTPLVRPSPSGVWRVHRERPAPAPPASSGGDYSDSLLMVNGREMRCRIVSEKAGSLSVELPNGVVVDFPKDRIAKIVRKKSGTPPPK